MLRFFDFFWFWFCAESRDLIPMISTKTNWCLFIFKFPSQQARTQIRTQTAIVGRIVVGVCVASLLPRRGERFGAARTPLRVPVRPEEALPARHTLLNAIGAPLQLRSERADH